MLSQTRLPKVPKLSQTSILMVSKPVVPPWNDSAKNLVKDIAENGEKFRYHVMTTRGFVHDHPAIVSEQIYGGLGGFSPSLWQNARVLGRLSKPDKIPLYHFFFAPNPKTSLVARGLFQFKRRKVVHTICSAPKSFDGFSRLVFADKMVAVSRHTADRCIAAGVHNVQVIPPGIQIGEPISDDEQLMVRQTLGLDQRPIVLFAGDYEFSGAADRVLQIALKVLKQEDVQFVYACRPKTAGSAAIETRLKGQVEQLGLQGAIRFVGQVRNIKHLLATSLVTLMPAESLYAKMDLPLVLIEALAYGVPVLISDCEPLNELIEGSDAGVSIAVDKIDEFVAQTLRLITDNCAREQHSAAAREHVKARFNMKRIAAQYESLYEDLLNER